MTAPIDDYTGLITSEHNQQPNFMAVVAACVQPFADITAAIDSMVQAFDLDVAVGAQLDIVGLWVGVSRYLDLPLTGVYFSLDMHPGLDEGALLGEFDPVSGLVALPDESYRTLLYATIAANHWDGTIPTAYAVWATLYAPLGFRLLLVDHQDMSMDLAIVGVVPDAVTKALIKGGYLDLRPAGVRISYYYVPSAPGAPIFGLDAETADIAGLDVGALAEPL